jgi:glycosyltransferase involved in cell wall biosynthesis
MSSVPRVSVVLAVYNTERYVREAIDSILGQTFEDFEFIIVNDGSTDGTTDILLSYEDPRIVLLRNEQNSGVTRALNRGLARARGEYIARMDPDDFSMPERLEKLVAYLDAHPAVGLVGAWSEWTDEQLERLFVLKPPTDSPLIKWTLLFRNSFVHPSVMYRRSLIERLGGYGTDYALDRDLWTRLIPETEMANLPEILHKWRRHPDTISVKRAERGCKVGLNVSRDTLARLLGVDVSVEELLQVRALWEGELEQVELDNLERLVAGLEEIFTRFCRQIRAGRLGEEYVPARLRRLRAQTLDLAYINAAFLNFRAGNVSEACKLVARATSHDPGHLVNIIKRLTLALTSRMPGQKAA